MLLFFSLLIQYIHKETRHSCLPQALEQCFCKTPNYFYKITITRGSNIWRLTKASLWSLRMTTMPGNIFFIGNFKNHRTKNNLLILGIVFFRKLQSDAFVRLQAFLPLVLVIYFKIVLGKHSSESSARRLCLVSNCIIWISKLKK